MLALHAARVLADQAGRQTTKEVQEARWEWQSSRGEWQESRREWQEVRGEWLEASGKSSEREEGRPLQLMSVEEVAASAAPFHAMVPGGDVLQ